MPRGIYHTLVSHIVERELQILYTRKSGRQTDRIPTHMLRRFVLWTRLLVHAMDFITRETARSLAS